jgi:small subunit ribosomal protein S6
LRTYEALYIVRPDLRDDEIQTTAREVESLVTNNGGAIVRSETWGKRRLAYVVDRYAEGHYVLLRFEAPANMVAKLQNHFRLSENVIRDLIVYFDPKMLRLVEEQRQRNEAEMRATAARAERERDRERERERDRDDEDEDERRPRRRDLDEDEDDAV